MLKIPLNPTAAHQRFMAAICDDILARDRESPRAKAVAEIIRQQREGKR